MSTENSILNYPCPSCGNFTLVDEKTITCSKCSYTTRKLPLKTAYDYGSFVFRFGHQYKFYYEKQLVENGKIELKANLEEPHELHVFISLPLLSGIISKTSWFLVKGAIATILASYNERNNSDYTIPDEDLKVLNINFREFVNNFADVDPKIRNAVFEGMFAEECSKKDKEKLLALRNQAEKTDNKEQKELNNKADKLLEELMKKTFKKIAKKPKPTEEELASFWLKVMDN